MPLNRIPMDMVEGLTSNLDDIMPNFKSVSANESAPLGNELASATGWTSTGWTGDFNTGFTCPKGNTNPLIFAITPQASQLYQVVFTINSPSGSSDFTVQLGNSATFDMYKGAVANQPFTYTCGIQAVSNGGNLVITPSSDGLFDGTITNISIKQILSSVDPTMIIQDSTDANSIEIRPTAASLNSFFIGQNSGRYNTTGENNVAIGDNAMSFNTSGYWDTAIGVQALQQNTVGSRNIAIGYLAMQSNVGGDRNVAIGTFAMQGATQGHENVAIGPDSLQSVTTASGNIGIGTAALASLTSGQDNIVMGNGSGASITTGIQNIAIGRSALNQSTDSNSVAIGRGSLFSSKTGTNIAMGYYALNTNVTGTYNVGIGHTALQNSLGGYNIALGYQAGLMTANSSANNNILIGDTTGKVLTTGGDFNVIVGSGSGYSMTTGTRNLVIGPSAGASITTGSKNIIIGWTADAVNPTDTQTLNIGNTIYGNLATKQIGMNVKTPSANLHIKAGATSPGTAPLKIDSGGYLLSTPEVGAIEFDGTNLYFTRTDGTRHQLQVVA